MMKSYILVILGYLSISIGYSQPLLTDVAESVGVIHSAVSGDFQMSAQGGAAWFDYNNDGWYDLYLTGGQGADALFKNNGDGSFTDKTLEAGIDLLLLSNTTGVTTGDINRDGWDDIFVSVFGPQPNRLLLNNGDGSFTEQVNWAGQLDIANSFSASFCDLNMDGWLDLYIGNWATGIEIMVEGGISSVESSPNFYYQNNGDGSFSELSDALGIEDSIGCALGILITDYDQDNDLDIYLSNDFGYLNGNSSNRLFRNDFPVVSFTDVANVTNSDLQMNGMGVAKGDIDEDGDMEFYITDMYNDKLLMNNGSWYLEVLEQSGLDNDTVLSLSLEDFRKTGWGVGLLDIDNDTDLDCFTANGDLSYVYPSPALDSNKLFMNDGTGMFSNVSYSSGVSDTYVSRALAYCDYDLDGDLDVFVGITDSLNGTYNSLLYRNDSPPQNWLEVKATGVQNNLNGIGVKVNVYVDGRKFIREIGGESSFNSQHWHVAHFGLANYETTDSINVIWPGGDVERLYEISVNQLIEVVEGQGVLITDALSSEKNPVGPYPNPFSNSLFADDQFEGLELFDLGGNLIATYNKLVPGQSIDTSKVPPGNYLLKFRRKNGEIVRSKLLKY